MESSVDFPQPEGPAMEMYVPFLISRCISDRACVSTSSVKKTFFTPSILITFPFALAMVSPSNGIYESHLANVPKICLIPCTPIPSIRNSFIAQRHDGIDSRRSPRWDVARNKGHQADNPQRCQIHRCISRVYPVQQRLAQPPHPIRRWQSYQRTRQNHPSYFLEYQPSDMPGAGPQRQPNSNLTRPLNHEVRQYAVNPQRRQQRSQPAKRYRKPRDDALRKQILVHDPLHRFQVVYRQIRVRSPNRLPHGVRDQ